MILRGLNFIYWSLGFLLVKERRGGGKLEEGRGVFYVSI
jgi:hypothetical protein